MSVKYYSCYVLVTVCISVSEIFLASASNHSFISGPMWRSRTSVLRRSAPSEHKYAVMVVCMKSREDPRRTGTCSGSLVTKRWVLTAGHCINDYDRYIKGETIPGVLTEHFILYAGGTKYEELLSEDTLPYGAQALWSDLAIFHPHQAEVLHDNDIGLIRAESPGFKLNNVVGIILMAMHPYQHTRYYKCNVTGFGTVYQHRKHPWDGIRKTQEIEIIDIDRKWPCQEDIFRLVNYSNPRRYLISSKPQANVGICAGDSGAGLVCNGDLHGIASLEVYKNFTTCFVLRGPRKCGTKYSMSFFFDPCQFASWIVPKIDKRREYYPTLHEGHDCWNIEHLFGNPL